MNFAFFNRLRAKPEQEKRRIALASAAFLTGIVFILWALFWSGARPEKTASAISERGTVSSLFHGATQVIGETIYTIKEAKDALFAPQETVYPDSPARAEEQEK